MQIDLATLAGLVFGISIVSIAIASGSDFSIFLNWPGFLIVMGGTFAATMIKFPISGVFVSMPVGFKAAFSNEREQASDIVDLAAKIVKHARKNGLISLQNAKVSNLFLRKGLQLCADGKDEEFIRKVLTEHMAQEIRREKDGALVFHAIGESAPAFGMFGTLVGLVQMLSNMSDPTTIGPAMAVAMLTTLYGVLIAQLIAFPISEKLKRKVGYNQNLRELVLESVIQIQKLENPTTLRDVLAPYLPSEAKGERRQETGDRRKSANA